MTTEYPTRPDAPAYVYADDPHRARAVLRLVADMLRRGSIDRLTAQYGYGIRWPIRTSTDVPRWLAAACDAAADML